VTLEEAIEAALALERKVTAIYERSIDNAADPVVRRFFETMAAEEQEHVDYLRAKLEQWKRTGKIDGEALARVETDEEALEARADTVEALVRGVEQGPELRSLLAAYEAELEAGAFYRTMVETLPLEGRLLFSGFVDMEEKHQSLVLKHIRHVTRRESPLDF
jgi:rubrerythrin